MTEYYLVLRNLHIGCAIATIVLFVFRGLLMLADDAPVGVDIRTHLQLDDTIFTLKLTPNLAHGLSVYGIAREVAARHGGSEAGRASSDDRLGRRMGRVAT